MFLSEFQGIWRSSWEGVGISKVHLKGGSMHVQAGFQSRQVFLMKIVIIKVQVIFKGSGRSSNQSCF